MAVTYSIPPDTACGVELHRKGMVRVEFQLPSEVEASMMYDALNDALNRGEEFAIHICATATPTATPPK